MARKRKPPTAKTLVENSINAYYSAIEIHNKPNFRYRYEIVIMLIINSWELLLKAFIYKFRSIKIFEKDGTTKSLSECINFLKSDLGKDFLPTGENIESLKTYRDKIIHFYNENLDIIIYSLIEKNLYFYHSFIKLNFEKDLNKLTDLYLLPIGFKKPFSPIDFLSNESQNFSASKEVKDFLENILERSEKIYHQGIEEPIIGEFKLSLENSKNIKNSDLVAMVNNSSEQTLNLELKTNKHEYYATEDPNAQKIQIVNDKTKSEGKLVHEELKEGIFDEINNVVDANEELRREKKEFMLGENLFYQIYAERKHVNFRVDFFEIMCWSSLSQIYGPAIFWFSKIPSSNIAKIISERLNKIKFPYGHFFVKIIGLLGKDVVTLISDKFNDVFKDNPQPPDYYYSFNKMIRSGEKTI